MNASLALIVRAAQRACALRVEDVAEVMRPLPLEAIPGAPDFVPGLCVIRGIALPVVDLGAVLEPGSRRAWSRFVTVKAGERRVALAVDEVLGVESLETSHLAGLPPLLGHADGQRIEAIGAADARLLLVLRAARLVPAELWATLSQAIRAR